MAQKPSVRRRIVAALVIAAVSAMAISMGVRLASYGVPIGLITPCVLGVLSSSLWLLIRIEDALRVHRCTTPGCSFQVRVENGSAAENERWRALAATHPHRAA
ncbi:hypothetical protein [Streptomyces jeddahensis]|uniref:Uncharacterized protein n=1 Tax=Streptomyces jeddahensis TaxID=1716141 RepID=A0A177HKX6_9ACTN|nr:hypothetical protein [Streptomyces jeddahensis]OAH11319.1 hypothetical protein STSP_52670 [Streptomyces jeddahensis]